MADFPGALIGALLAPVLGAMLYPALHTLPLATKVFDRVMLVGVPALVLYHVISHAWPDEILVATLLFVGGIATPILLERLVTSIQSVTDSWALVAGISGFAVHVVVESAALRSDSLDFVLALILHRIGVGLLLYWLVRPHYGFTLACLAVGGIVVGTLLGYFLLGDLMSDSETAELYQYFVSGMLLHVIFHRTIAHHRHDLQS